MLCMLALPSSLLASSVLVLMTCRLLLLNDAAARPVPLSRFLLADGGLVAPLMG
jgi:hypothetical protein